VPIDTGVKMNMIALSSSAAIKLRMLLQCSKYRHVLKPLGVPALSDVSDASIRWHGLAHAMRHESVSAVPNAWMTGFQGKY
jgi:hypothetical protein